MGVQSTFSGAGIIHDVPKASASNLISVSVYLTLNSHAATAALDVITAQKSVNFRFYCEAKEIYEPVSPGDR